ncbi:MULTISPECIES: ABC transporter ATP-binding protein [unclassified Leptolyngbya]|uniref:ABC transporter ATP-binding protein n=1 Tax=unclassified Leptolyngbya TaxID=2650499 RepID=UPI0016881C2C|nr:MULTISPECIES: ABC transporter ATP-binding protein [unclassified Leptolyngbya]MBD1909252.1 ABC transporter ATP-binding protein [Leptolyngbya sp. FACHB-8]MBD2156982.1 ABC transporter ATP-binding protein [Leptolyngbya sp. FACHB-16]
MTSPLTNVQTQSTLIAQQLTLAYDDRRIVQNLNLDIPQGQITALVGANGCGKSTLLRGLSRLLKPEKGTVYLDGKAIAQLPTRKIAQRMAILPQGPVAPEGLTVRELVAQGRYPHQSWLQQWSQEDEKHVEAALETTGLLDLAERPLDTLSGGQRQRAWIAMTLAQNTDILLLDEPTTFLDLAHQIEVLDLLYALNQSRNCTVVMVLHELNQACRYADFMVAMRDGHIYAQGTPVDVMTETTVRDVFGLDSRIIQDPVSGTPLCIPVSQMIRH